MDEERWEGHELANFVALEVPDEVPLGLSGSKLFALVDVFGDVVFAEMSDGGRLQGFGNGLGRMFFGDTDECDGLCALGWFRNWRRWSFLSESPFIEKGI